MVHQRKKKLSAVSKEELLKLNQEEKARELLRRYATSRKVGGSTPDGITDYRQYT
jgi:hypothetical protein